jgi:hypothetical protein
MEIRVSGHQVDTGEGAEKSHVVGSDSTRIADEVFLSRDFGAHATFGKGSAR